MSHAATAGTLASEDALVQRHFVMQAERPAGVATVEVAALEPFLRSLLFTDGTVTRALGVQTLAPVLVEVLSQARAPLPALPARYLEIASEEDSVRRRVGIAAGSPPAPVLWAESYIVPDRLPSGFLDLLDSAPDGIGDSLQRGRLESWRELLWFGLGRPPQWAPGVPAGIAAVLTRMYRVCVGGTPTMLIAENFAVERRGSVHGLVGVG